MKKIFFILLMTYYTTSIYAQDTYEKINTDSVSISNHVEFFTYNGPYGDKENIKEPAVKFILTVKNKGTKPIPDLDVTNRSAYVNLYINDSIQNPISLYNGIEAMGDHLIKKDNSDSYTWWVFENEAYGNIFTVQWQYMGVFSKKVKVNIINKRIEAIE